MTLTAASAAALEERLGHRFARPALLEEALTHSSALVRPRQGAAKSRGQPAPGAPGNRGYDRLEFLGDRVLGLIIADRLFERFPDDAEGDLTRRHTQLVRRETLTAIAEEIDLARFLILSAGEAAAATGQNRSILSDVCEALIAALYLDGGLEAARRFVLAHWEKRIDTIIRPPQDPKTALQEWSQRHGGGLPSYETVAVEGPDHERRFTIKVTVEGLPPQQATGSSKRAAEAAAAAAVLALTGEGGARS